MASRRRGWVRLLRALGVVLGGLVGLVLLALVVLNTPLGHRLVLTAARQVVPGLEVGRVSGLWPWEIEIYGVRVRDRRGEVAFEADELRLSVEPLRLLSRRVVAELELVGPRLTLEQRAAGWNIDELVVAKKQPAAPSAPSPWTVEVKHLLVTDGLITDRTHGVEARRVVVEASLIRRPSGLVAHLERAEGVIARAHDRLAFHSAGELRLLQRSTGALALVVRDLSSGEEARLEAELHGAGRAGEARAFLHLARGEMKATATFGETLHVRVESAGVDPSSLLAALPAGSLTGTLDFERSDSSQAYLAVSMGPSHVGSLSLDQLAASLSLTGARAEVELRLRGLFAGTRIDRLAIDGHLEDDAGELALMADGIAAGKLGTLSARGSVQGRADGVSAELELRRRGLQLATAEAESSFGTRHLVSSSLAAVPFAARVHLPPTPVAMVPGLAGQSGVVDGQLSVEGTLAALVGHVRAAVRGLRVGELELTSLALSGRVNLDAHGARLEAEVRTPAAPLLELTAVSGWHPRLAPARRDLVAHVDVVPTPLVGLVHGALQVTGGLAGVIDFSSRPGAPPRGTVDSALTRLAVRGLVVGDGALTALLERHAAELHAALYQPGRGRAVISAAWRPGNVVSRLVLDHLEPRRLEPLAAVFGNLVGPMSGTLTAAVRAGPGAATSARLDVSDAELGVYFNQGGSPVAPRRTDWRQVLAQLPPVRLEAVQVHGGRLHVVDASEASHPSIDLTHVEIALENLATRRTLLADRPSALSVRARVEGTGELWGFSTFDPLAAKPTLAGEVRLQHLTLASIEDFLAAKAGLDARGGWFDCYVAFRVAGGRIEGGVQPALEQVRVTAHGHRLIDATKAMLANVSLRVFHDGPRGMVTSVVPIEGSLEAVEVQLVPTTLRIVRSAFVVGLASSLARLSLVSAAQRQGLITQSMEAPKPASGPPKAQPPDTDRG